MESLPPIVQESDDNGPSVRLGKKLREARKAAGYGSHQALADVMNCDRSTVTKIESGKLVPSPKILTLWCELCHVDEELYEPMARLARTAEESAVPAWYGSFYSVRRLAHTIRTWHPNVLPGSLQIPDYSRGLYEVMGMDDDRIGELVAARSDVQDVFTRTKKPATLLAVVAESVLRLRVGSDEIMHAQLTHLTELGQRKNVGLQVVPDSLGCNAGHVGAFTIVSLPGTPDILLTEGAVRDTTTDEQEDILQAHRIFDKVRLDALSRSQSLELIAELTDQIWRSGS